MNPNPTNTIAPSTRLDALKALDVVKVLLLLGINIWTVRYWQTTDFGLFEYDYTRISKAVALTTTHLWDHLVDLFTHSLGVQPSLTFFLFVSHL
jgi:hypothetical protein